MRYVSRPVQVAIISPMVACAEAGTSTSDRRSLLTVREHNRIATTLEAADWFVRLDDDRTPHHDRTRYLAWLKQSPVHVAETLHLIHLYGSLRSIFLPPSDAREEDASRSNLVDCKHSGGDGLH